MRALVRQMRRVRDHPKRVVPLSERTAEYVQLLEAALDSARALQGSRAR